MTTKEKLIATLAAIAVFCVLTLASCNSVGKGGAAQQLDEIAVLKKQIAATEHQLVDLKELHKRGVQNRESYVTHMTMDGRIVDGKPTDKRVESTLSFHDGVIARRQAYIDDAQKRLDDLKALLAQRENPLPGADVIVVK